MGHTKFSPDWCFGLFKRLYKKTKITYLDDIVQVVERSASVNNAQLVVDLDGNTMVQFLTGALSLKSTSQRLL